MTSTLSGLIYVKHGRLGTRSEGPDYYLQTAQQDYLLRYQERNLWEPDYLLEFYARAMVEVTATVEDSVAVVTSLRRILTPFLPRPAVATTATATPLRSTPLQLRAGEGATLSDADVQVEFLQITEDSRCPVGAVCIWEGQVIASLRVSQGGKEAEAFSLTLGASPRRVLGHDFKLVAVEPQRTVEAPNAPVAYVITLQVEPVS